MRITNERDGEHSYIIDPIRGDEERHVVLAVSVGHADLPMGHSMNWPRR
jgi:hypothetical protein